MGITVDFMITRITLLFAFSLFSERQYSLRLAASASIVSTYLTVDAYAVIVVSPLIGFEVDCHLKTEPWDKTAPLQEKVGKNEPHNRENWLPLTAPPAFKHSFILSLFQGQMKI